MEGTILLQFSKGLSKPLLRSISERKRNFYPLDKHFKRQIKEILGFKPKRYAVYQLALIHKSAASRFSKQNDIHNERLEFLGDAILDSVIAEHLYESYPGRDEGFLTQMRSKIVNRETLRNVALTMGLDKLIVSNLTSDTHIGLYGDALEALIGAIYLDKGYGKVKRFITQKLLQKHINLNKLIETETDFKSRIIEWGQKNRKDINFTSQEQVSARTKKPVFVSHLLVFDEIVGMGMGKSKKEAEQNASKQAIQMLGL